MPFSDKAHLCENGVSSGRMQYKLTRPLYFWLGRISLEGLGVSVLIDKGFLTDFASTPRLLWPIFPPAGRWMRASILHDYLYSLPGCSRFLADALFREAMHDLGVPWWRRVVMYYAVRLFGGFCKAKS